jgi:hypothetical protein
MKWPLTETPEELIQKNTEQAHAIASHVRALNQGRFLTSKDFQESNDDGIRTVGLSLDGKCWDIGRATFMKSYPCLKLIRTYSPVPIPCFGPLSREELLLIGLNVHV